MKLAKVSYAGSVKGVISGTVAFNYVIDNSTSLKRDFNCSVVVPGLPGATEFHPFINGVSSFTMANFHPRSINFGPDYSCDNKGTISFKQETH